MTSPALLEVSGVTKSFGARRGLLPGRTWQGLRALDDVSISVARHETLALVGESGSGKSTLARVVVRLVEPDAGRVLFDGQDLLGMRGDRLRSARRRIQMVFQNPYSSLNPRRAIGHTVAEPALVHGLIDKAGSDDFVKQRLETVGLPTRVAARLPRELSGGQRQRVAIARALAVDPELLIADEAVSALDVSVQAQILNLLQSLQRELGLTMVFISHQLPVVRHVANRVAVMYLGRIVEAGPVEGIFTRAGHPYTTGLLEAQPGRHRRGRRPAVESRTPRPTAELLRKGCSYRDRCPLATALCESTDPPPVELANGHVAACHYARRVSEALDEPAAASSSTTTSSSAPRP